MKFGYKRKLHNRKVLRLKGYDYSSAGHYFLTNCCQNRTCLFGKIENGEMILNDAGKMVEKWYYELENKYPDKRCHEMVIMPNHMHCIIENILNAHDTTQNKNCNENLMDASQRDAHVRTSLCGRPVDEKRGRPVDKNQCFTNDKIDNDEKRGRYGQHNKIYGASISDVMDWFKTMTTNEYIRGVKQLGWKRFDKKLWQRSFNDKIVRTEYSLDRIRKYIINNPANWGKDKFYQ
jgi:putative transposase